MATRPPGLMASKAMVRRGCFCILAWLFLSSSFDDCGVMGLNQSVGDQLAEQWQEGIGRGLGFDELDAHGQVLFFAGASIAFLGMRTVVRPEAGRGADHGGAGHAALLQE
jgi:hypothetical protein